MNGLLKAVTSGAIWPLQPTSVVSDFAAANLTRSNENLTGNTQSQTLSDAFKEAFINQLSYVDIIELLDLTNDSGANNGESITYSTLQLINQLSEGNTHIQRQFFSAGLIQKLKRFTAIKERREVKVEVAYFVGQVF